MIPISAVYIQWAIVRSKIYSLRIFYKTGKFCYQYIERRTIIVDRTDELYNRFFFAFFYLQKLRSSVLRLDRVLLSSLNLRSGLINRGEFFLDLKSIGNLQDRSTGQKRRYQNGERLTNCPARSHVKGGKFSRKGNRAGQRYREKLL